MKIRENTKYIFLLVVVLLPGGVLFAADHTGFGLVGCDTSCGYTELIALINRVINFLLIDIAAPLATLSFAWAGFLYITAAGDSGKIGKAHDIFRKVIIGMLIAFGAWVLVHAVLVGLGVDPQYTQPIGSK